MLNPEIKLTLPGSVGCIWNVSDDLIDVGLLETPTAVEKCRPALSLSASPSASVISNVSVFPRFGDGDLADVVQSVQLS